jgi:hypothetical protein
MFAAYSDGAIEPFKALRATLPNEIFTGNFTS